MLPILQRVEPSSGRGDDVYHFHTQSFVGCGGNSWTHRLLGGLFGCFFFFVVDARIGWWN